MDQYFTYDTISTTWADLVRQDPSKRFVQYPWALAQLPPQVRGLRILDIGCGEGGLSRVLARRGAVVCGYDNSIGQIQQARLMEEKETLGITYIHADPVDIVGKASHRIPFDIGLSVAVFHYATDRAHLETFFSSTYRLVKPGGHMVALVMNSGYKRFGQTIYNRKYYHLPDGRVCADFLDSTGVRCSTLYQDYTRADYEESAARTGWEGFTWRPVTVTAEGRAELGAFWDGFDEDCPYAGFTATKPGE